ISDFYYEVTGRKNDNITQLTLVSFDNYDSKKLKRSFLAANSILRIFCAQDLMPITRKIYDRAAKGSKGEYRTVINITYTGDNANKFTIVEDNQEKMSLHLTYDNKHNPYYQSLFTNQFGGGGTMFSSFSKNNVVSYYFDDAPYFATNIKYEYDSSGFPTEIIYEVDGQYKDVIWEGTEGWVNHFYLEYK
ncbi:MAG: hypothetical protein LBV46_04350, partial [Bacteroidales bacterium]|nr:hypothetical protein [Bacteroidales bacterium]